MRGPVLQSELQEMGDLLEFLVSLAFAAVDYHGCNNPFDPLFLY